MYKTGCKPAGGREAGAADFRSICEHQQVLHTRRSRRQGTALLYRQHCKRGRQCTCRFRISAPQPWTMQHATQAGQCAGQSGASKPGCLCASAPATSKPRRYAPLVATAASRTTTCRTAASFSVAARGSATAITCVRLPRTTMSPPTVQHYAAGTRSQGSFRRALGDRALGKRRKRERHIRQPRCRSTRFVQRPVRLLHCFHGHGDLAARRRASLCGDGLPQARRCLNRRIQRATGALTPPVERGKHAEKVPPTPPLVASLSRPTVRPRCQAAMCSVSPRRGRWTATLRPPQRPRCRRRLHAR